MYARLNMIFGRQDRLDAGLAQIEDTDRRAVEATAGNRGLATLVDRDAAVIVAISYWDEPLRSSESLLTRARETAAAAAGGDVVTENFEVVAAIRPRQPSTGVAAAQIARVQVDRTHGEDVVAFYRAEIVPQLEAHEGLCTAELMIDRDSGFGLSLTVWADDEAAARAKGTLEHLRDELRERAHAKITRIEAYNLVGISMRPSDYWAG